MAVRRTRLAVALLAAPGAYLFVHLNREMLCPRYVLPPVPFMLIAAAWGAHWLSHRLRARRLVLTCLVALACADPLARSMRYDWLCTQEDTRVQVQRWIGENVPRSAIIMFEGLWPPITTHPYSVYARGLGQIFSRSVVPSYFVSITAVRRFRAFHERLGEHYRRNYARLDATFPVVAKLKPWRGDEPLPYTETIGSIWRRSRPGPHVRVYKLREPLLRPADVPVMLAPPLSRADWRRLACWGPFPLGMLTAPVPPGADPVEVTKEELTRLGLRSHVNRATGTSAKR